MTNAELAQIIDGLKESLHGMETRLIERIGDVEKRVEGVQTRVQLTHTPDSCSIGRVQKVLGGFVGVVITLILAYVAWVSTQLNRLQDAYIALLQITGGK